MKERYGRHEWPLAIVMLLFCALGCGPMPQAVDGKPGTVYWSYSGGTGPASWGDLSPDFMLCKTGRRQSPIDLSSSADRADGPTLEFEYANTALSLVNNGHTIQHNVAPGSFLTIRGKRYQLLQFHFHSGSEHTLDGDQAELEMHLVHQSADGEYAVVGVLFEVGRENAFLNSMWDRMPSRSGESIHDGTTLIDVRQALPADRTYFSYVGSFTTPPGTEGVRWCVFRGVMECSSEQLARFRAIYSDNFRPVQELHGRKVRICH